MRRKSTIIVVPSKKTPHCKCGQVKVSIFQETLESLMDNMGCELGPQFVGGPFCPQCEAEQVDRARQESAAADGPGGSPAP